ncbi:uncharacterized protein CCR75_005986 [Bremia lactucae]|uniref:Ubiquitinyl hydrolase 1 n=1 Tax=Bremia lactucae TaxID=4779 RepID=A0A976IGX6_BRELC|nr:hypothetical protein CCR75_005986 [Bremia lactucae]
MSDASLPQSARKGLRNDVGANNCFLNVIIQSLWHIRSCRVLVSMGDHAVHHNKNPSAARHASETATLCLLCELEQLFVLYQFAEQPVLDVTRVRIALGETFALGAMNDATETLETILDALHSDTLNHMLLLRHTRVPQTAHQPLRKTEDMSVSLRHDAIVCEPQCVAHRLFQMNLMELTICASCGHTAEPVMHTKFLYRVYAYELLTSARTSLETTLEDVLRVEAQSSNVAGTCDACDAMTPCMKSRWILTLPMVFAISLIWSSTRMETQDLYDWMELLAAQRSLNHASQQALDLGRIFRLDLSSKETSVYAFRGLVCYYGCHYVGFFASRSIDDGVERERWFLFDDTRVKLVGTWADVRSRIERGAYQPTLLFYERKSIQLAMLEEIATEIHTWWAAAVHECKGMEDPSALTSILSKPLVVPHELECGVEEILLEKKVPSRTQLEPLPTVDTSAISQRVFKATQELTQKGRQWGDQEVHFQVAHQNAQETLSRLNGILSQGKSEALDSIKERVALPIATSESMRSSVCQRDYLVKYSEDRNTDVNPNRIFEDESPERRNFKSDYRFDSVASIGERTLAIPETPLMMFDVCLNASDGGIGLLLEEAAKTDTFVSSRFTGKSFVVSGFEVNGLGAKLPAEASGVIRKGDVLVGINGHLLDTETYVQMLEMLLMSPNPVQLTFCRFQPWACPQCTLLNTKNDSFCAACGHAPSVPSVAGLRTH